MATVNQCNIPEDLYYLVEKHVWARLEGDLVTIGLSDVAQHLAHTVISVSPRPLGKSVPKGRSVATVESGKWVGPVPAPVSGNIVETNDALSSAPSLVNEDPYGAGWIAKLRPEDWAGEVAGLVTGPEGVESYRAFLDAEGITCGEGQ
ncbi:MAG: glycine cleavage system protein GcvH [Acidimicrobiales bacterium]